MNTFAGGLPVWHVSVSWRAKVNRLAPPKRLDCWTKFARAQAVKMADLFLRGVGVGENIVTDGNSCLHIRRRLSDDEMRTIDQEFLTCEPIDFG